MVLRVQGRQGQGPRTAQTRKRAITSNRSPHGEISAGPSATPSATGSSTGGVEAPLLAKEVGVEAPLAVGVNAPSANSDRPQGYVRRSLCAPPCLPSPWRTSGARSGTQLARKRWRIGTNAAAAR